MPRPLLPAVADLDELPVYNRAAVIPAQIDALGHLSFPFYLELTNTAWWAFNGAIGLGAQEATAVGGGIFALEHYLRFLAEVTVAQTVALRLRLVGLSAKRIHYVMFMVNETAQQIAFLSEGVGAYADLATRRTAPFPSAVVARLAELHARHAALPWTPPLCGVLRA